MCDKKSSSVHDAVLEGYSGVETNEIDNFEIIDPVYQQIPGYDEDRELTVEERMFASENIGVENPISLYEVALRVLYDYVERRGYSTKNLMVDTRFGDADLVVFDENVCVLFDLRVRTGEGYPTIVPGQHMTLKYTQILSAFLQTHAEIKEARMDLVTLKIADTDTAHLKHAVEVATVVAQS